MIYLNCLLGLKLICELNPYRISSDGLDELQSDGIGEDKWGSRSPQSNSGPARVERERRASLIDNIDGDSLSNE